jgi:membrane fusion protein, adhesin transport system
MSKELTIIDKVSRQIATLGDRAADSGSRHADFMPGTLAVTEQPPPQFARMLIAISGAFFVVGLLWMLIAQVDQVVVGSGTAKPEGNVQTVNHLSGGKVTEIFVKNGDRVKTGQKLLRLDPILIEEEVGKLKFQYKSLLAEVARLNAELNRKPAPVFSKELGKDDQELISNQLTLFRQRQIALDQQRQALQSAVKQNESQIVQYEARIRNSTNSLALSQQQATAAEELERKGYYPKMRVLSVQREVSGLRSDVEQSTAALEAARAGLAEAQAKLTQFNSENSSRTIQEFNDKNVELNRIRGQLEQIENQQKNLDLLSPADGFVEKLKVNNVGQIVPPQDTILQIVPESGSYIFETKVRNSDVGKLQVGQDARMKLTAFDFQRFGVLNGKVERIATDSTPDERTGEPYFTVRVKPDQNHLGNKPERNRIQSGMTAEVDFHTGKRSIMSYVIDTMMRTTDEAFRE